MSAYDRYSQYCFDSVHRLSFYVEKNIFQLFHMSELEYSCFEAEKLMEVNKRYSGPMVWVGVYIAIASIFCILAMAADLFHGFRNRKFWFPCKYFSLNAASITVITVAMKLPVDLTTQMPGTVDQSAKVGSMAFMCIMMANIMPSLASMENKTLLANIVGLAILIITIIVNIFIQITTGIIKNSYFSWPSITKFNSSKPPLMNFMILAYVYIVLMLLVLLILISSAIIIPTSKEILEFKYQATSKTTSNDQHIGMSTLEKLRQCVRRYWVMAETGSPQFVMASNQLSNASGIICVVCLVTYTVAGFSIFRYYYFLHHSRIHVSRKEFQSDYKWSTLAIFITQFIGVIVGSIAPIFRCFTILKFKLFTKNHLAVFTVEKYWTQKLYEWKESRLPFLSTAHRSIALVNKMKSHILCLCIGIQKTVVVSCKMIGLIRIVVIIFGMCCSYCLKSLKALLVTTSLASISDDTNEDLSNYVLQIQDEMEFAEITVKEISNSIDRLIQKVKKEQHDDLFELLGKSTSFKGLEKFDIDQVQHLLPVEPVNSWSLPIVTLTCIAVSLPNICKDKTESLLKGVGDGLSFTRLVEDNLNSASEYVNSRRAAMILWHEVEDNYRWLGNTLERNAYKGKTSSEILKWFGDKAQEIVIEIMDSELIERFPNKLIVANSMYRIAETVLLLNSQSNTKLIIEDQDRLFALLSCMISDILSACLTNIPRAITTKCHESVIEKREARVEDAARLLGRSTEIINKLEACELPCMYPEKMAFIDEWRLHVKQSIP